MQDRGANGAGTPPAGAFQVRNAEIADMAAVREIYRQEVEKGLATFEESTPSVAELEQRRQAILAIGLPYLVADAGGTVLGYSYASNFRPRVAYRATVENSVYVGREARRRGVARALLTELIARCETAGKRQMIAVIGDSANTASIELHRQLGFRMVGTLESAGLKFGRWVDVVIMQRALDRSTEPPTRYIPSTP